MASQISEISKIYTSRVNLLTQLGNRGYDVSDYIGFSVSEIQIMTDNDERDILVSNSKGHKVYVKYQLKSSLRPNNIKDLVEELYDVEEELTRETDQIIILSRSDPNDTIKSTLTQLYDKYGYFVTVYSIKRLMFNVLDHELVPEFTILSNDEKIALYKELNIMSDSQLPEMSRFDPVSLAIGFRPGSVCRIIRKSKTAIQSVYYRICV